MDITVTRTALAAGFEVPSSDLADVLGALGTKLFTRERTLVQYVAWSVNTGLLEMLHARGAATIEAAAAGTPLTPRGADALLSVLSALGLVRRSADGCYSLCPASREFLLRESPYFIGDQLEPVGFPIHGLYLKKRAGLLARMKLRLLGCLPLFRYGTEPRIENQHVRNLAASACAVRTGEFARVRCIADIAGGSGVFTIPLLLEYPHMRVVLTELPQALPNVQRLLTQHGVQNRVLLQPMDAFVCPWALPACDGVFIGNFLHGFSDDVALGVCREAFSSLPPGGMLWLHEMLWNDTRDGPLLTALWHAAMISAGMGGQRTAAEWIALLDTAGFSDMRVIPTSSAFALVAAQKPNRS